MKEEVPQREPGAGREAGIGHRRGFQRKSASKVGQEGRLHKEVSQNVCRRISRNISTGMEG